jgi:hypothetical protein
MGASSFPVRLLVGFLSWFSCPVLARQDAGFRPPLQWIIAAETALSRQPKEALKGSFEGRFRDA